MVIKDYEIFIYYLIFSQSYHVRGVKPRLHGSHAYYLTGVANTNVKNITMARMIRNLLALAFIVLSSYLFNFSI